MTRTQKPRKCELFLFTKRRSVGLGQFYSVHHHPHTQKWHMCIKDCQNCRVESPCQGEGHRSEGKTKFFLRTWRQNTSLHMYVLWPEVAKGLFSGNREKRGFSKTGMQFVLSKLRVVNEFWQKCSHLLSGQLFAKLVHAIFYGTNGCSIFLNPFSLSNSPRTPTRGVFLNFHGIWLV